MSKPGVREPTKPSDPPNDADPFDTIVLALERDLEVHAAEENASLPESLRDPLKVIERGRELLQRGFEIPVNSCSERALDEDYRMAVRNGKRIPDEVRLRMRSERERAETELKVHGKD
jgi:hypothetical protein